MRKIALLLLLTSIVGCGQTLKEMREYPPTRIEATLKESYCIYSKLYKAAIEHPMSQQGTSCFGRWQSTWDPSLKEGEIFTGEPWDVRMLFQIYGGKETIIKIKTEQGIRYCMSRYKQYAEEIFYSADFSLCPDSPISD